MICPFPNLTRTVTAHLQAELSFSLDAVTTWKVFSGYPKFKSMTIVPDPIITQFVGVFVLKTPTLEIKVGVRSYYSYQTELLMHDFRVFAQC
jgi:hypothetical protein